MATTHAEQERLLLDWDGLFKKGTDFDLWGQPLEAITVYSKLSKQLRHHGRSDQETFTDEHKKILAKTAACLELRCKSLQHPGKIESVSLDDLKAVEISLNKLLGSAPLEFPLPVSSVPVVRGFNPATSHTRNQAAEEDLDRLSDDEKEVQQLEKKSRGSLLPPPAPIPGQTLVTVRLEKIFLKDATQFIDPYITVSVKDARGRAMTEAQDTPLAAHKEDNCLIFAVDCYVQRPPEVLPKGFAIFFEFKHYKPKKRMISTKCWSCMEQDEIKEGSSALELYKKPTDFKRKKISLLTVKPMYLHVKVMLN